MDKKYLIQQGYFLSLAYAATKKILLCKKGISVISTTNSISFKLNFQEVDVPYPLPFPNSSPISHIPLPNDLPHH